MEYLGHIVSCQGVSVDPKKTAAIQKFPQPVDLKSLRSFVGLASYYRRFVPGFSRIAGPLYALTKKDTPFVWTDDCQRAFDALKCLLTEAPLLVFPDFSKDFQLETDASGEGLGAVLAQRQGDGSVKPIAFASRTLQAHERNYGVTEMEALGVVWAVQQFRHYLYGHKCTVFTDHEALRSLLNTPHPSGKLARWGLALQELDLQIQYRPGKHNANADTLSRFPLSVAVESSSQNVVAAVTGAGAPAKNGEPNRTLTERQKADPELQMLQSYLEDRTLPHDETQVRRVVLTHGQYALVDDILYHVEPDKTLRVIPPATDREELFLEVHRGPFGGHLSDAKIHSQLSRHYWWPGMRKDITHWTRGCLTCASRNVGRPVKPLLTPIPVGGPFDRVGVDVLQLPLSRQGNRYAVVFMDYLTKWPEVFAVPDQTALTIARLLVEQVISRHGVPSQLLSDRGPAFLSNLVQELCAVMGMRKVNTTAYHPQTDGLVERFNRNLTDMLAKTTDKGGQDWDTRLPYVLFAYRCSMQSSTMESPFFLLYGRDPRLPTETALTAPIPRAEVDLATYKEQVVQGLTEAWGLAQSHVRRAQDRQKKVHDQHAVAPSFQVGDRVFLYEPAAKSSKAHKFARPFSGPHRIVCLYQNGADIRPVDKPQKAAIRVSLNQLRPCPVEIVNQECTTAGASSTSPVDSTTTQMKNSISGSSSAEDTAWTSRLRPRQSSDGDARSKNGEM